MRLSFFVIDWKPIFFGVGLLISLLLGFEVQDGSAGGSDNDGLDLGAIFGSVENVRGSSNSRDS